MTNIKALRKAAGYTQQQLADLLKVARATVGMWEVGRNNPPAKYLLALADALGCTVEDLLKPA